MSYKYFPGLRPEDDVIDSSSLSKFRKLRLSDENILDILIGKSVEIAIEKGIVTSKKGEGRNQAGYLHGISGDG